MAYVQAAVKAIIAKDDTFLVLKQRVSDQEFWSLPGGKVDHGESPYDTLKREIKEEVHLDVDIGKCLGMWWFFRIIDGVQVACTTFVCRPLHTNVDTTKNPSSVENISEFKWVTKEKFLTLPIEHDSLKELIQRL